MSNEFPKRILMNGGHGKTVHYIVANLVTVQNGIPLYRAEGKATRNLATGVAMFKQVAPDTENLAEKFTRAVTAPAPEPVPAATVPAGETAEKKPEAAKAGGKAK